MLKAAGIKNSIIAQGPAQEVKSQGRLNRLDSILNSMPVWCIAWCLILFFVFCSCQDNGPYYPLRTRQALQFQRVPWSLSSPESAIFAVNLGTNFAKNPMLVGRLYGLYQNGRLSLLGNSKTAGKLAYSDTPAPGEFIFKNNYLIYAPGPGFDPPTDSRTYELYYPQAVPPAMRLFAQVAAVFAIFLFATAICVARIVSRSTAALSSSEVRTAEWQILLACSILFLTIYFSTGSLTPYNLFGNCFVSKSAPYFLNFDHVIHLSLFDFLDGRAPASKMLLRRILFPVMAYPLMKTFGFAVGGLIASFFVNLSSLILFGMYCQKRYGAKAATISVWLLSTFPGFAYFAGLPYVYAILLPVCLAMLVLLSELERRNSMKEVVLVSLGLGSLNLGYDMLVFCLPAAVLMLLTYKRVRDAVIAGVCCCFPSFFWLAALWFICGKDAVANANTSVYANAVLSYSLLQDPVVIQSIILGLPSVISTLFKVYFTSTFYFLPSFFLVAVLVGSLFAKVKLLRAEACLLLTAAALFLFSNCAPEYYHSAFGGGEWQLKGDQFARIYLPLFAVFISYIARLWENQQRLAIGIRALLAVLAVLTVLGNGLVSFGPMLNNPFAISSRIYHDFYIHAPEFAMQRSLQVFGRNPVGFFRVEEALKYCNADGSMKKSLF